MSAPSKYLLVAIGLLAADATIELGFVTSMVAWLHSGAPSGSYTVVTPPALQPTSAAAATYQLPGKPLHMLVDQGHTSNGAAGSALVLIGILGSLALLARARARRPLIYLYHLWMALQVPALLLTVGALGYVAHVTHKHSGQTIDQSVARTLTGPYPLDEWTPQNWFAAVLHDLDLASPALRRDIARHYHIMQGWRYNLIPLFLLQLVETGLAFHDFLRWRKAVQSTPKTALHGGAADLDLDAGKHV